MTHTVKQNIKTLALAALGVVFGDIGTSPLYAIQECFAHGLTPEPANIVGVVSLIFWSLTIVVSLKYALIVMRADNHGEGGVFSLLARVLRVERRDADKNNTSSSSSTKSQRRTNRLILIGMFGAALFFGDSIVTPAISVLSAVEGVDVLSPSLHSFIIPIATGILLTLFFLQRFGSQKIGNSFGPIMVGWFLCLAALGISPIARHPEILMALNPVNAFRLIAGHGVMSFTILGAALLAFTGGEALYADMGHFGLKSIRLAWYGLVMPALAINYLGQGALLLANPHATTNPFYLLAPSYLVAPMIILAAVATVVASQAVISGTFSLVCQAMRMDYLPRFSVVHTSSLEQGQVYLPKVNIVLCLGVIILVLMFRSSSALAGAYGFAVGGAMLVDTVLVSFVARHAWHWVTPAVALVFGPIFLFDLTYFATAAAKIPEGGWLPLGIGIIVLTIFRTWRRGREIIRNYHLDKYEKLEQFVQEIQSDQPARSPGTSVYLTPTSSLVPAALTSAFQRYHVLRENILVLEIRREEEAVSEGHRITVHPHGRGFWQVILHYGFSEHPQVVADLRRHQALFKDVDFTDPTFFVGRSIFVEGKHLFYPRWRKKLFLRMAMNVQEEFDYSRMPPEQMIQIGTQIEI